MVKVTWPQVLTWRTRRHLLDRADGGGPVEVARRFAGVQAQVAAAAQLAVVLRQAHPRRGPRRPGDDRVGDAELARHASLTG
jgi:hypothetical protein